jgi:RNA polymerase sigma factor (sigma-70 family)
MWATPIWRSLHGLRFCGRLAFDAFRRGPRPLHSRPGRELPVATNGNPFQFDPHDSRLIRSKIHRLVRHRVMNVHDGEDLEQLSLLHLWQQLPKYDPRRGGRRAFIIRVINNFLSNYLRNSHAAKRHPPSLQSLDQPAKGAGGDPISLGETVSQHEYDTRRGDQLTPEEAAAWALNLAEIMARLPEPLRALLSRLLLSMTVEEAAADLGINRSTGYRRLADLRARLHEIDPDRF